MRGLHIIAELSSQIWAMEPTHLNNMASVLRRWSTGAVASPEVMAEVRAAQEVRAARAKTNNAIGGGIAVLELAGIIAPKATIVDEVSGGGTASLQDFGKMLDAAVLDNSIGAIIINFDTPGGNVVMTPETAAKVLAARATKPVYGFVSGMCASAGYWIGSACTELYATQSATVGSIGVYTSHIDESAAMAKEGYAMEYISAGTFKVEGNSLGPLGDEARAFTQSQINDFYGMFTSAVAKGRGVPVASVRDGFGQGRCLLAKPSLDAGLIDGICSFEDVVAKARKTIRTNNNTKAEVLAPVMAESLELPVEGIDVAGVLTHNKHATRARLLQVASA